jgi:D-glycero-D-manno-heptose 1,7-bisphosphate phosphatase
MQAVILVGGLGTRLGDRVRDRPKPLLDVAGTPFLFHLIGNLARFGFDDIVLLAGYRSDIVGALVASSGIEQKLGIKIRTITEPEPLGTGGALRHAAALLDPEFLLLNGDSLLDFNLLDLPTAKVSGPWLARMALRTVPDASRFGVIALSPDGRVEKMLERPDVPGPGLINGGVYWMRREIVEDMPEGKVSLEADIFPALATRGVLHGRVYDGFFIDVGVPDALAEAETLLPTVLRRPAVFFDRDGVLNKDAGYTHKKEDFVWIDGAKAAVRRANDAGWFVFVVSNQAGVARGLYEESAVVALHRWVNEELRQEGAHIDAFRFCPHHPDGTVAGYDRGCRCRKPQPGMIEALMRDWQVDTARSFLIGDRPTDIEAAEAGGLAGILFDGKNLDAVTRAEMARRA